MKEILEKVFTHVLELQLILIGRQAMYTSITQLWTPIHVILYRVQERFQFEVEPLFLND
ncbi:hypothetical protein J2T16_005169 [Paenibacillus intestini]|nr:hypothetical protein [Paenibacillus intestini]